MAANQMDWANLFSTAGSWINPMMNIFSSLGGPVGAGLQAKGYDRLFQGMDRKQDAWKKKYDDERRLMNEYNQDVHGIWGDRQALRSSEQLRQDKFKTDRAAAFQASMNKEKDLPSDIEAQFLSAMDKYKDIPDTPTTTTGVDTDAPSVVSENLAAALAKESAKTGTRQAAKARMLAPGLAMTDANLEQADQASLLKSLGGRGLDSAQVASREQALFEPAQLYPTQYTGIDPRADKDLAYGQMLINMGDKMMPSWSSMFSQMGNAMFPQQRQRPSWVGGSGLTPAVDKRLGTRSGTGSYGSFPTWSNWSGRQSGNIY